MAANEAQKSTLAAFGGAVREARVHLGLSQEELCFRSQLDRTYISGIERGVRNPTLLTMERIAASLGTTLGALVLRAETLLAKK
jgi:transcriptional regulator with XRE-family HTH domain